MRFLTFIFQAARFEAMGLLAAAVTGDTYSKAMQTSLDDQKLNAILTSSEMCFEHPEFRKWLRTEPTAQRILAVIVDEDHCASQWAGDFRPQYGMLDKLRILLQISVLVSNINLDESFYLNLGNDRPNITPSIVEMKGTKDYDAINGPLPDPSTVNTPDDLPRIRNL
ncbi:hypothetical protein C8R44DRAFT_890162 [Mycena epipterygia]|nr:hypothetical protein C8R44DRAFT_890162 [Mycena epipterygia]